MKLSKRKKISRMKNPMKNTPCPPCPNCGEYKAHFVPPSLGEEGFFICEGIKTGGENEN